MTASIESRVLNLLEFPRIMRELDSACLNPDGRRQLAEQPFLDDRDTLREHLQLVVNMSHLQAIATPPTALSFTDLQQLEERLSLPGTTLEGAELYSVGCYLRSARILRQWVCRHQPQGPVASRFTALNTLEPEERDIFRLIDEEGQINSNSSPVLRRIVRQIASCRSNLQRLAMACLRDDQTRAMWNSDVPTLRDGRTVLPLRTNYRGRIAGLVHGVSGSGATLYFETQEMVTHNNDLREYEASYQQEVRRLLRELTGKIFAHREELESLRRQLGFLDTMWARACYGRRHHCVAAIAAPQEVNLIAARHPLLGRSVVPINLSLGVGRRHLLITGPNTGGKTVALKTVALLALMNQFALEIPAQEGSRLPLFNAVYADIGDEQSISTSLSTFSAHIATISDLLGRADHRSLVLLDELGAGTDPEEGAALAMAILTRCQQIGCYTLATSHHGVLKQYAYRQREFNNASVEFDRENLRPTYRLIVGVPGSSHALHIAQRVGLPKTIVEEAQQLLQNNQSDSAQMIERLTIMESHLQQQRDRVQQEQHSLAVERQQLSERRARMEQQELQLREGRVAELDQLIGEGRRQIEQLIRELREEEADRNAIRRSQAQLAQLTADAQQQRTQLVQRQQQAHPPEALRPGLRVTIIDSDVEGWISQQHRDGNWVVETDKFRIILPSHRLCPVAETSSPTADPTKTSPVPKPNWNHFASRSKTLLDLRGCRLAEARQQLEEQIDQTMINGQERFEVIHGLGTGALQQGVRELLAQHPAVKRFEYAPPEQGGFGKTVVLMRHGDSEAGIASEQRKKRARSHSRSPR